MSHAKRRGTAIAAASMSAVLITGVLNPVDAQATDTTVKTETNTEPNVAPEDFPGFSEEPANPATSSATAIAPTTTTTVAPATTSSVVPTTKTEVPSAPNTTANGVTFDPQTENFANAKDIDIWNREGWNPKNEYDIEANRHRIDNAITGFVRIADRTNHDPVGYGDTPLPVGTPVYLEVKKPSGEIQYFKSATHESLALNGYAGDWNANGKDTNAFNQRWNGAFGFDLAEAGVDLSQDSYRVVLGEDGIGYHKETGRPMTIVRNSVTGNNDWITPDAESKMLNHDALPALFRNGKGENRGSVNSQSQLGFWAYVAGPTEELKKNAVEAGSAKDKADAQGAETTAQKSANNARVAGYVWYDQMKRYATSQGEAYNVKPTGDDWGGDYLPKDKELRVYVAVPKADAVSKLTDIRAGNKPNGHDVLPQDRIKSIDDLVSQNPDLFDVVYADVDADGKYSIEGDWNQDQMKHVYAWVENQKGEIIPGMIANWNIPEFRTPGHVMWEDDVKPDWVNNHYPLKFGNVESSRGETPNKTTFDKVLFAVSPYGALPATRKVVEGETTGEAYPTPEDPIVFPPVTETVTTTPAPATETTTTPAPATGTTTTPAREINSKCIAAGIGFGLPLLALLPLSLAGSLGIPVASEVDNAIRNANIELQKSANVWNPELAGQVAAVQDQLNRAGVNGATVAGGAALAAVAFTALPKVLEDCGVAKQSDNAKPRFDLREKIHNLFNK